MHQFLLFFFFRRKAADHRNRRVVNLTSVVGKSEDRILKGWLVNSEKGIL